MVKTFTSLYYNRPRTIQVERRVQGAFLSAIIYLSFKVLNVMLLGINTKVKHVHQRKGERGGSVVECRTPEREVRGSRPTAAVLCP